MSCRVSKSIATVAMDPSGRGMPPWLVPVCTLTLEMLEGTEYTTRSRHEASQLIHRK